MLKFKPLDVLPGSIISACLKQLLSKTWVQCGTKYVSGQSLASKGIAKG